MAQASIIDGNMLASRIRQDVAAQVEQLACDGVRVCLAAIMVGDPAAGEIYARSQRNSCQQVGIEYQLHALGTDATESTIRERIRQLNNDRSITGLVLNLPLPAGVDTAALQYAIDPYKDVEGVNPANIGLLFYDSPLIAPCTAQAVMEILKEARVCPRGLDAVVVGQGAIVGKPVSLFLLQQMATVICCHIETRDLRRYTRMADVLVVAAGNPGLIGRDYVRPGAVVIDVGINRVPAQDGGTRIVGDVDFGAVAEVAKVITPVPGGVGPVTVAILLRSVVQAAQMQMTRPRRLND